ncbi:putative cobalamin biosynthesis protein CobG [Acrocarpospora pleiomorpha]|uniref:Putative cobalamin biosynthesis protein CobG n=1 Tax=Acrocarpospora pleiomorpha TaxID=90975 RepID=A0A5M3Y2F0_9ACTN|nr:precorrin-3B synthase [Acrocarpospora pleiomorpha]GES24928.1 putative cobalamin biosynthesis protein CobG [Acrocarpospora pleiomorpha]
MPDPIRTGPDACPGALQLHQAADGPLARVRVPGGELSLAALRALTAGLGDGFIELTSRANVQVRALRDPIAFAAGIAAAGLLPSPTHERVRNILASPLTGLGPRGILDVRPLVTALDKGLCSRTPLAALPGRFLFALDDGTGDVATQNADISAIPDADSMRILLAGEDHGLRCPIDATVHLMLTAAESFLTERTAQSSEAWRLSELHDGPAQIAARLSPLLTTSVLTDPVSTRSADPVSSTPAPSPIISQGSPRLAADQTASLGSDGRRGDGLSPVGVIALSDGTYAIGAVVPLGRLSAAQVVVLAEVAGPEGIVRLTPRRGVVVAGLSANNAASAEVALGNVGLVTDPRSPWVVVTACTGRPGCAKSLTDVQADARTSVGALGGSRPVHWAGCERRCGRPRGEVVDVVAVPGGYRVDFEGVSRTHGELHAVVEDVRSRRIG